MPADQSPAGAVGHVRIPLDADTELRLLGEADAERLFALTDASRAYLRVWLPWVDSTRTVEDTRRFIRAGLHQKAENNGFHMGIWHRGVLVGVIGYNYIDWSRRRTELGYWLGQMYQGRGLMTAACQGMIRYAFETLRLHRVEIHCALENHKSRAIPVRLGFRQDGIIQQAEWLYSYFVDEVVYSLSLADWQQQET
jgi:ribosomal-protein-serine acetyltransferase